MNTNVSRFKIELLTVSFLLKSLYKCLSKVQPVLQFSSHYRIRQDIVSVFPLIRSEITTPRKIKRFSVWKTFMAKIIDHLQIYSVHYAITPGTTVYPYRICIIFGKHRLLCSKKKKRKKECQKNIFSQDTAYILTNSAMFTVLKKKR